jgi:hypothetical protein
MTNAPTTLATDETAALPVPHPQDCNQFVPTARRARALIGWMAPEEAALALVGRMTNNPAAPTVHQRAKEARDAVDRRAPGVDQVEAIMPAPASLDPHIAAVAATQGGAAMLNEKWQICLADLRRICAFQPYVHSEYSEERTAALDAADYAAIAAVTLPLEGREPLSMSVDAVRQQFMCGSRNPNLKIVGHFSQPIQQGIIGVGFAISVLPSFMSIAKFQGRYFLHDGYHRAYGLLRRNIYIVPVFMREFGTTEQMNIPPGMLPQGAYFGDRPPLLPDYLNDRVAADVTVPTVQKLIVVQGLELAPLT